MTGSTMTGSTTTGSTTTGSITAGSTTAGSTTAPGSTTARFDDGDARFDGVTFGAVTFDGRNAQKESLDLARQVLNLLHVPLAQRSRWRLDHLRQPLHLVQKVVQAGERAERIPVDLLAALRGELGERERSLTISPPLHRRALRWIPTTRPPPLNPSR